MTRHNETKFQFKVEEGKKTPPEFIFSEYIGEGKLVAMEDSEAVKKLKAELERFKGSLQDKQKELIEAHKVIVEQGNEIETLKSQNKELIDEQESIFNSYKVEIRELKSRIERAKDKCTSFDDEIYKILEDDK